MKRATIIGMAAFYLLLTTGMFVCVVHCSAQNLVSTPHMTMAHAGMGMHNVKKHCDGNKDCDCCKKHGNYVVKENIKPGFELQFAQTGILVEQPVTIYNYSTWPAISTVSWTEGKAPPGKTGKLLSIQYRSLQI
jgi:hypothetical protein